MMLDDVLKSPYFLLGCGISETDFEQVKSDIFLDIHPFYFLFLETFKSSKMVGDVNDGLT